MNPTPPSALQEDSLRRDLQVTSSGFEQRKIDHLRLSLSHEMQADGAGFEHIQLQHEALPELSFSDISLNTHSFGRDWRTPFLVSSMTAGHEGGVALNQVLARVAAKRGWLMGVGSQRRQLFDSAVRREWEDLRALVPDVSLMGNLGLSQAIQCDGSQVQDLVDSLGAIAMVIHTNPLQECLQPEGTPDFRNGLSTLERLCGQLRVPVVLKETGCGFSANTLRRLQNVGLAAVDISGFGGTHWGRIEGARAAMTDVRHEASRAFSNWGVGTVESLLNAVRLQPSFEVWASGGVRTGVDAVKAMAVGAARVGFAKPALDAAVRGEEVLNKWMEQVEYEFRTALFCTGVQNPAALQQQQVWQWRKI